MPYEPLHALRTLQDFGVRFVVIGGIAARLWGSPTMTNDTDVCYARDTRNLERLAESLQSLHARLRGVGEDVPFLLDAQTLANGQNFTFVTDDGSLDVLGLPSGVDGFEELSRNAVEFDVGEGLKLPVCDLDDLIRMKRAAGRPKDRIELEVLAAVREELDRGPADI
jgi:predicted nucleotidyltransferase